MEELGSGVLLSSVLHRVSIENLPGPATDYNLWAEMVKDPS